MSELSNLHAAYLRSIFERSGMVFGVSLPLVLSPDLDSSKMNSGEVGSILLRWIVAIGDEEIILDIDFNPGQRSKISSQLGFLNSLVEVDILRETSEKKAS